MYAKPLFATLAFALAAMASAEAHAQDGKIYPGSMCQGLNPASENLLYRFAQYLENTSATSSALVSCPIVKDNVSGMLLDFVRISFTKVSSTGFYCAVYGRDATGGGTFSTSQWNFDPSGTYNMVLPDVAGFASGSWSMYCIIPPGGRLQSYRMDEL